MTPAVQPTDSTSQQAAEKRGKYRKQFIRDKKNAPVFHLQDRDVSIIQAVLENRYLTLPILAQIFPPDEAARRRKGATNAAPFAPYNNLRVRLRNLFHYGYLYRFRIVIGGEHIYAVDFKGVQLLKEKQIPLPLYEEDWRPNKETPATLFVNHTLMVARLRAALIAATRVHPSIRILSFQRESLDLKAEWRHEGKKVVVNPDAFFMLRDEVTKNKIAYFLEADRSTMTLVRLCEKYKKYSRMYTDKKHLETFGVPTFRVLTICKSEERARNALEFALTGRLPKDTSPIIPSAHHSFYYFTSEETYAKHPQNILADIWNRTDTPKELQAIIAFPLTRM